MAMRMLLAGCLLGLFTVPARGADEVSVADLSMEVSALRLLHALKVTPEQMKAIRKLTRETAQPRKERNPTASKEYKEALQALRDALVDPDASDNIDDLEEKVDELQQAESPKLDDDIEVTAAARKRTPEVLRSLKPAQVAAYLGAIADDAPDPLDRLLEALAKVRTLKLAEWKEQRDDMADSVSSLVAGIDPEKAGKVNDQVIALLSKTRIMSAEDYEKNRADLEKEARGIIGELTPTDVLRNLVEHALAEMLSNPRLDAALAARLK